MAGLDVLLGGRKRPTIIGGGMLGLGFPAIDPSQGGGPVPDAGFVFITDDDGTLLTDDDGSYLQEAA